MVSCPLFSGGAFLVFWKKIADGRLAIAHSGPSDVAGWSMVEGGVLYPRQSTVPMQTGYRCFSARRDPSQRSQRRCRMVDGRRRCVVPASIDGADANGISLLLGPSRSLTAVPATLPDGRWSKAVCCTRVNRRCRCKRDIVASRPGTDAL